ncbi:hypothetical protein CQA65_03700 [Klebsiella pneumoniae]|nr:hypothetical protein CQA65_03700 [Klebsiella pneumoniae]PHZ96888.1 hypothetical protein CS911_01005 [Klebsiella variicola]RLZ84388.1 hypothetical protein EA160_27145 [Klebsiella pneumoniae]
MFLPGRTGDPRPFNGASNTVDHCLSAPTGALVVAYSRLPLFLPGITGDARPFNRTSHTVDHCLQHLPGA